MNGNGKPHGPTLIKIGGVVLGLCLAFIGYLLQVQYSRVQTDTTAAQGAADAAKAMATSNDKEIALLKLSLETMKSDLGDLKAGQRAIMDRFNIPAPQDTKRRP